MNHAQRLRSLEREVHLDDELSALFADGVVIVARTALNISGVAYRRGAVIPVDELATVRNLRALVAARAVAPGASSEERKPAS